MPLRAPFVILVWLGIFFGHGIARGQNLLVNPGLSDVNICTEYSSPCEPSGWWRVSPAMQKPFLVYNPNGAPNGENYMQIVSYGDRNNARYYMQTQMLCPMVTGKKYRVVAYVASKGDKYPRIDFLFCYGPVYTVLPLPLDSTASVRMTRAEEVKQFDKQGERWHVYEKIYTATQDYPSLVLGDFSREFNDQRVLEPRQIYIDSIAVVPVDGEPLCAGAEGIKTRLYKERNRHTLPKGYENGKQVDVIPTVPRPLSIISCDTIVLRSSLFTQGVANMGESLWATLDSTLNKHRDELRGKVKLTGHVKRSKSENYNVVLSRDWADAVVKYLVYRQGYSYDDFEVRGLGSSRPRYDTATEEGRLQNDRVEMVFCHDIPIPGAIPLTTEKPQSDTLLVPDVLFKHNSAELDTRFALSLDSLVMEIPRENNIQLQVIGHTDSNGSDTYNLDLSQRRANTVAGYLTQKGFGGKVRFVNGEGEARPVAPNTTAEGRQKNRRVEIIISKGLD